MIVPIHNPVNCVNKKNEIKGFDIVFSKIVLTYFEKKLFQ